MRERYFILGAFLLALGVRLVYLQEIKSNPFFEHPVVDAYWHDAWAAAIARGDPVDQEVFFRAPLYPYFLAALYRIFGHSFYLPRLVQLIIGTFSCMLLYLLGRRMFGRPAAVIACGIAALYGPFLYFETELLIPSLIVFLDLLLLWALLRAEDAPSFAWYLFAGVLLGLSADARPNILLFLPCVLIWIVLVHRRRGASPRRANRHLLVYAASFCVGAGIAIAPVTFRNYLNSGDLVLISSQGGINFYIGNNPRADGRTARSPGADQPRADYRDNIWLSSVRVAEERAGRTLKPSEVSRFWFGRSLEFIRQEPLTYLKLLLRKLYLFWNGYEIESNKDLYFFRRYSLVLRGLLWRYGLSFPFGLIAPLALTGILLSLRERRNVGLLYLFVGSYVLSVILFFVTARYRIPVIPFLILFGAYALYWIYRTARAGRYRELALPLCCTVLFALISNSRLYGATDSDSARMHGLVGTIYAQQGLYDKAIAEFRAAVTRDPDSPKPHCFLGMIYRKIGAYGAAADAYRAALKIRPDYTAARCDLALIYREEGLYREAAAEYRAALRFSPGDVEARHNLAEIYYLQKLYDRARTEYEKVLEITPNVGSGVYYRLGVIYDKLGDHAQAARRYRKAIEIDPGDVRSYYGLGLIYHRTDRSEEAVELYRRAARIDPDRGRAHFNLGTLYDRQGLHREAMSAYERALRFRPDMAEAYVRLGILYSRDDRTGKAAEMFRRALEIDPNDERARAYLDASLNRSP